MAVYILLQARTRIYERRPLLPVQGEEGGAGAGEGGVEGSGVVEGGFEGGEGGMGSEDGGLEVVHKGVAPAFNGT